MSFWEGVLIAFCDFSVFTPFLVVLGRMGRHSNDRDPCPWRMVEDAGGAFGFGLAIGTIWHGFGGLRNAPRGLRISQAVSRVAARVPLMAGGFAAWGLCFSIYECSFSAIRNKEDMWNQSYPEHLQAAH